MSLSPITHTNEVVHIKDLETAKIIQLYQKDFSMDVQAELGHMPRIGIYQCKKSLLRFYENYEEIAGKDAFYCQLARQYPAYYSEDKWEFNAILPYLKSSMDILEIGAGHGYFLQKLRGLGFQQLTGLEISSDAVEACRAKGFDMIQLPIEELTGDRQFDAICSFQIFEHLPNVDAALRKSIDALRPGGLMSISVPNNHSLLFALEPYHTLNLPPHHVMLWDEISLRKIADLYGLELVDILKSEASSSEKSRIYKAQLTGIFGSFFASILHPLTRFMAKKWMGNRYGACIIALYRKK